MGHLFSAQLAAFFEREHRLSALIEQENYREILSLLQSYVHSLGSTLDPLDLMEHATGEKLNSKYFSDYLSLKYEGSSDSSHHD